MTNTKKTVVIVSPYFPPDGGGLEKYVENISQQLVKNFNWRVVIITTSGKKLPDAVQEFKGIKIYKLGYRFKLSNTPFDFRWRKKIKLIFTDERADVINVHAPVPGLADIASSLCADTPCVVTYHSDSLYKPGKHISNVLTGLYEKTMLPYMLKSATSIICSSDFVRFNFLNKYSQKSVTINPATDTELFRPKLADDEFKFDLVFVAGLNTGDQYKGLWTLIDSLLILKDSYPGISLCVVGTGDMINKYKEFVEQNNLSSNVTFLGRLESLKVANTLKSSKLFVLPTSKDSYPTVILEAMAAGLPVITTNTGSIGQIIIDRVNGFIVKPNDSQAIADKISILLANNSQRIAIGLKNREDSVKNYSWSLRAHETNNEFMQVIQNYKSVPKTKVLILASGSLDASLTYRVRILSKELSEKDYDVTLVVPSADKYNKFLKQKIKFIDKVKVLQPFQFSTKLPIINLIPYIVSLSFHILRHRYDLVYLYKPTPITIPGIIAKKIYKTPLVLDMDDIGAQVMLEEGQPKIMYKLVAWCEKIAENSANAIVVTSSFLRNKYAVEQPGKPVMIVPNGVDAKQFKPLPKSKSLQPRLVFFGAFNHRDILDPLFIALPTIIKAIPKTKIIIIGDGTEMKYYKTILAKNKLAKNVEFTGWLSHDDAIKHFRYADIGYAYKPNTDSVKAASLMKVPQYMALGIVPLVSNVGDLPEYVKKGKAGYICTPDNPEELSKIIITALRDTKGRSSRAETATHWALESFDWKNLANDIDGFLRKQHG